MIRLSKGPKPSILVTHETDWTKEYLEAKAVGGPISDTVRYRYRHPEIKVALKTEAHGKCIYCESKLATGETDHIEPVNDCPEKLCTWTNLGLACKECNTNKGAYYAPTEPLINPFTDDPSAHLLVAGCVIIGRAGDDKGLRTESRLKLSRTDLIERRYRRVLSIRSLVERWLSQPAGHTKDIIREALQVEAGDASEYAATVRAYLFQELGWTFSGPSMGGVPTHDHDA